jgi:hypothetical protein
LHDDTPDETAGMLVVPVGAVELLDGVALVELRVVEVLLELPQPARTEAPKSAVSSNGESVRIIRVVAIPRLPVFHVA